MGLVDLLWKSENKAPAVIPPKEAAKPGTPATPTTASVAPAATATSSAPMMGLVNSSHYPK